MIIADEQFEQIVNEAIDALPERFKDRINNLAVLIDDFPNEEQASKMKLKSQFALFGLYEGHIQSRRINFGVVLPDRITIFKQPILSSCQTEEECRKKIIDTVKHEIAHHFGSDEEGAQKASKNTLD